MQNFEILAYSIVQGITEFIPVSSSAHLYVTEIFFNWKVEGLMYALAAHLGTLLAVIYFEKKTIYLMLDKLLIKKEIDKKVLPILICILPVILTGLIIVIFFKEIYTFNITTIAIASIFGAVLLDVSDKKKNYTKQKETLTIKNAFIIGIFQTLSLIPGMSRSGTILTASRFLGYTRTFSIEIALLTSIPVITVASCYAIYNISLSNEQVDLYFFYITIITFIFAFFSINLLMRWVKHFSFRIFVIYRILFGLLLILYVYLI